MDPNNLDNFQNSELGKIQPLQPVQPMQPVRQSVAQPDRPIEKPVEQPVQPEQPTQPVESVQPEQPIQLKQPQPMQPAQPAQPVQPARPAQPQKPKPNFMLIGIIAGIAVLLVVICIVVAISMNSGNNSKPPEPTPEPVVEKSVPTPELVKSVCAEYDGEFESFEDEERIPGRTEIESMYICKHYKNMQETDNGNYVSTYVTGDFEYQVDFIKEDKIASLIENMKKSFETITDNNMKFLKESEDMVGYYGSTLVSDQDGKGIRAYVYNLIYENTVLSLIVYDQNSSLAMTILEDLGFPDPAEMSNKVSVGDSAEANQRNEQRKEDYDLIITSVNSYMASHDGRISNMVKDADPHTLTASRWMNESGEDPNGKPYELKAYSWDAWNNAPVAPFDNNGSQVFIVINANCNGTDTNGNSTPAKDRAARSFAVYGYLEGGTYCRASGSAE